ncbi:unnamed protein product [Macrosiphum euphorbiae]|uniref:Uncharacterized protein n=1 Tax=Macrosiphum euphorbiae TaxID=13131 RepID=A0AAV0X1J3_9HEMI|nr:unnamed protein product [Macrosiphum euphorbiae]
MEIWVLRQRRVRKLVPYRRFQRVPWEVTGDRTHDSNAKTGSERGTTWQSTRPCTVTTGTPAKPEVGADQVDRRRPSRFAHGCSEIVFICDDESINERAAWKLPERSRTSAVPSTTDGDPSPDNSDVGTAADSSSSDDGATSVTVGCSRL